MFPMLADRHFLRFSRHFWCAFECGWRKVFFKKGETGFPVGAELGVIAPVVIVELGERIFLGGGSVGHDFSY